MKSAIRICLPAFILAAACAAHAQAPLVLETQRGLDTRTSIAVPVFAAPPGMEALAREMAEVIAYDLNFTGLFIVVPPSDYPSAFTGFGADVQQLDLDIWRGTRAEFLVYGVVDREGDAIVAQFRLFDIPTGQQVVGLELRSGGGDPRLVAHRFSEEVVRHIEGTPGIATTEIFFSVIGDGRKEIYVADYDGANMRQLTRHNSISIMPEISPDGRRLAYLSYKDRYGFIYLFDRNTGQSTLFSREVGLNAAPSWSPDGQRLALTLSKDGNTEVYLRNLDGSGLRRLTNNRNGDTSPTFDPTGQRIAFVSDRGGSAQVYVMSSDGGNQQRISTQGGASYDPKWSPDGAKIAYVVARRGEGMQIYVMNPDGSAPTRLTSSGGINEAPTWSPDARHIMFSSNRSGVPELWTVTLATGDERRVPKLPPGAQGPSWGPRRN